MGARSPSAALAGLLLAASAAAAPQAQLERVDAAAAAGRWDEALEAARALDDPALAAEWASWLHAQAGDLPGSLREARAGQRAAPEHAGLLAQALNAALTLGLAPESRDLGRRLVDASAGADPAQIARAEQLAGHARELERLDALARRSVARARALVLAALAASVLALAALARGA